MLKDMAGNEITVGSRVSVMRPNGKAEQGRVAALGIDVIIVRFEGVKWDEQVVPRAVLVLP